jgi:hypothetical protein
MDSPNFSLSPERLISFSFRSHSTHTAAYQLLKVATSRSLTPRPCSTHFAASLSPRVLNSAPPDAHSQYSRLTLLKILVSEACSVLRSGAHNL